MSIYRAMGMVRFDELAAGMVLDADVVTDQGRLLLAAATVLTDHHLRVMRKWGVEEVDVRGLQRDNVGDAAASRLEPAVVESITAAVTTLFGRSDLEHPAVRELAELTRRRLLEHYASSPAPPPGVAPTTT